jgi:cellulose synthase/poly-beta-1,6-N-acetylglucosamine synthase-like glycosyltransferase
LNRLNHFDADLCRAVCDLDYFCKDLFLRQEISRFVGCFLLFVTIGVGSVWFVVSSSGHGTITDIGVFTNYTEVCPVLWPITMLFQLFLSPR